MSDGSGHRTIPPAALRAVRAALGPLVEDTLAAVAAANPVYAPVLSSPAGLAIRLGLEQAVREFLVTAEQGRAAPVEAADTWRQIGESEFREGRSLAALRAAFRSGLLAVWRSAARVASESGVEIDAVVGLAEALFVYADELVAEMTDGYTSARSDEAGERARRRQRLSALLLDPATHDGDEIARAAGAAGWRLPRRIAVVALGGDAVGDAARRLGPDVLSGADDGGGWLIVPDPTGPGRPDALAAALAGHRAAIGPAVRPRDAERSLRWARLGTRLRAEGLIPGEGPVDCTRQLADLLLLQDRELASLLAHDRLAPLEGLTAADRDRLLETLAAWLAHQRHTPSVAAALHVHPQTVRYRVARLRELLGPALGMPEGRFELELALSVSAATSRVDR